MEFFELVGDGGGSDRIRLTAKGDDGEAYYASRKLLVGKKQLVDALVMVEWPDAEEEAQSMMDEAVEEGYLNEEVSEGA